MPPAAGGRSRRLRARRSTSARWWWWRCPAASETAATASPEARVARRRFRPVEWSRVATVAARASGRPGGRAQRGLRRSSQTGRRPAAERADRGSRLESFESPGWVGQRAGRLPPPGFGQLPQRRRTTRLMLGGAVRGRLRRRGDGRGSRRRIVFLRTANLTGGGTIRANGASGVTPTSGIHSGSGGGGGGQIRVVATSSIGTGLRVSADGGVGGRPSGSLLGIGAPGRRWRRRRRLARPARRYPFVRYRRQRHRCGHERGRRSLQPCTVHGGRRGRLVARARLHECRGVLVRGR